MSTTASPASNRPKPPKVTPDRMVESPWHKAIPYIVFALIVVAVLVLMTLIFGQVSGEEFSPNTFEQRRFHYFQIPILRVQVTGIKRKDMGIGMANTVEDHAPNVDSAAPVKNWDLVSSRRVGAKMWLGDAKILCDLLTTTGNRDSGYVWQTWSEQHPHLADRFWPIVAETAQAGSYILMPDLFDLAAQAGFDSATGLVEDEDENDDKSNSEDDDENDEASGDKEESDSDNGDSDSDAENDDKEKAAGIAGEEEGEDDDSDDSDSDESDGSKVKKQKAKKKKKKKSLTPEQIAEADAFESTLRKFMAKEAVILADQFETADELKLARRAYELATKYSDDPATMENFDRLNELVPEEDKEAPAQLNDKPKATDTNEEA